MKNFVRSWPALLAFVCSMVVAGRAGATQTWTATFEKNKSGDVCSSGAAGAEFSPGINETKGTRVNAQVLGEQVYSGSLACKVTVHPDDTFTFGQNRVDIQHKSTLTAEGKDSYLSGHYMMPADAMVRNEIGFYETVSSSSNAMDIWVAPKTGGGTTINFAIGFLPDKASWTADFKAGVWHQIGIHVHWSQTATVGYVDMWLDGVKTVTMLTGKTKPDANALYYQTGLHRRNTYQVTDTIYFDDFYEGDAEADMHIAAPSAGGDGGMTSNDGGAAGAGGGVGATGAAGAGSGGTTGAAGSAGATGSTGAAGSASTGAAGATGAAGVGSTGASGSVGSTGTAGTGAAGTSTTGTAGTGVTGTGAAGTGAHASKSGGCAVAGDPGRGALALAALALLGAVVTRRRRS
jgi:MYXO-CTERM domain-containing protein